MSTANEHLRLDRATAPDLQALAPMPMAPAREVTLDNGIPVYLLESGTQEVVRLEFLFNAGSRHQSKRLLASATSALIPEGAGSWSALEVAEQFDFFGAYLQTDLDKDVSSISLYSMNRYLPDTLPVLEKVIKEPTFTEKALRTHVAQARQNFLVNQEKVGFLARRAFQQTIFGSVHPYGQLAEQADFDQVTREDLVAFHQQYYRSNGCRIIVSGKPPADLIHQLNQLFGGSDWVSETDLTTPDAPADFPTATKLQVEKADALQSAIRIGRPIVSKAHPDFPGLKVLNTILGGYFGSRLMANIREDKGYTYGIYSQLAPMQQAGQWVIGTEVGADVTAPAIREIYAELARLRTEPVALQELNLVKNYLTGQFLRHHDGPFSLADRLKGILLFGLDYDYYSRYLETIRQIGPEELLQLAATYFAEDSLSEVVAGNPEARLG